MVEEEGVEGRRRVRRRGAMIAVSVSVFPTGGSRCYNPQVEKSGVC